MTKFGIYGDITNEDYHKGAGVSKSDLDHIHRSPAHYMAAKCLPHLSTPAMELGTAVHAAVLEPDKFETEFAAAPDCDRRTKDGKAQYASFEQSLIGTNKKIVSAGDYDTARRIRDAVYSHRMAANMLKDGRAEQSVYWNEELDGEKVLCKCRPDYLRSDGIVVDLKTTEDARGDKFMRSCMAYRYYVQNAWYERGVSMALGDAPCEFIFMAVEKNPPYGIGLFTLPDDLVDLGVYSAQLDLRSLVSCRKADHWPCYAEEVQVLETPKWFKG